MGYLSEEEIENLLRAEKILIWIEERNFETWESALAPLQVNNKQLWESIQRNPQMSEEEFVEIVEQLMNVE